MTKEQVLNKFWSSFGIPAFDETIVDFQNVKMPYITYQAVTDEFANDVSMTASIWDKSESLKFVTEKANEINRYIGRGGKVMPCDGGAIWIKRGTPFAQNMVDDSDYNIRRKVLNITVEYLTTD